MTLGFRRVITGTGADGQSIVEIDEYIDDWQPLNGLEMINLWAHVPPDLTGAIAAVRAATPESYALPHGGSRAIIVRFPAWDELERARQASPVDHITDDGFHVTPTIDYVYVLEGSGTMLLDTASVDFTRGDVIVQRATRHAWRSTEGFTLLGVAVDVDELADVQGRVEHG